MGKRIDGNGFSQEGVRGPGVLVEGGMRATDSKPASGRAVDKCRVVGSTGSFIERLEQQICS